MLEALIISLLMFILTPILMVFSIPFFIICVSISLIMMIIGAYDEDDNDKD